MSPTPKELYDTLLKTFRDEGMKIIHRKLKGAGGLYCCEKNIITISTKYRNTLEGCYYLCHEKIHAEQRRYNEFPEFFSMGKKIHFDETIFQKVLEAEMDAVKRANLTLKMFGVPFSPPELTKDGFEYAKDFWKNYYFREEKK
jgi:hypothetical protein